MARLSAVFTGVAVFAGAVAASLCAAAPSPALAHSDAGASAAAFVARCDAPADASSAEWQRWSRETLPVGPDGVDFARIKKLATTDAAITERMLRLGLAACDPLAAQAITVTKFRLLHPELRALLEQAGPAGALVRAGGAAGAPGAAAVARFAAFRVDVVRAANAVDPGGDYGAYLTPLLADRDRNVRISAAMGARRFRKDGVTKALLDTVRRDKEYLVRYHAAQSLLELGDIYPRDIADHRRLFDAISGPLDRPPAAADFDRYALGARMLEKLMSDRAAGKCSDPVRPATIHGEVLAVGDRAVAVAVDAAESSCAREFALVVFVEAALAGQFLVSGVETTRDPTRIEVTTPSGPVVVEYARAAGVARLGETQTAKGENALVLAVAADGRVTARWVGRVDTKVTRGDDVVHALLRQSPALRQAVRTR
jgi:hypothetical protein